MINTLVLVLALIAVGMIFRRVGLLPEGSSTVLNQFVLNISLPAIIFLGMRDLKLDNMALVPLLTHWVVFIIHCLVLWGLQKVLKFSKSVFAVLLIVTTMGNTAFLGIPLTASLYGEEAISYAVLYDELGTGMAYIVAALVFIPYFTGQKRGSFGETFKGLMLFPPFTAFYLGLLYKLVPPIAMLDNVMGTLAATLTPVAMIVVGYQMKLTLKKAHIKPLIVGFGLKILIIPVIVGLVLTNVSDINHDAVKVSILQSGMPPLITAGVLAMESGIGEDDLVATLVGYGLVLTLLRYALIA